MKCILALLSLLFLAFTACETTPTPWKEPQGVGGTHWGMSMPELRVLNPVMDCMRDFCSSEEWLGEDVQMEAFWHFDQHKLSDVSFYFPTIQFARVRRAFMARYGPPHRQNFPVTPPELRFQQINETLTWEGPQVHITLQEYSRRDAKGKAAIGLTAEGRARHG